MSSLGCFLSLFFFGGLSDFLLFYFFWFCFQDFFCFVVGSVGVFQIEGLSVDFFAVFFFQGLVPKRRPFCALLHMCLVVDSAPRTFITGFSLAFSIAKFFNGRKTFSVGTKCGLTQPGK